MWGKFFVWIICLILLASSFSYLYLNLPGEPVEMISQIEGGEATEIIAYGATPVFEKNLRFDHNEISYRIDSSCSIERRMAMEEAFSIFEEKMSIISFYESFDNPDITVGCSEDFIELGENIFTAGEGGPSQIINTSNFKVIQKGKIILYKETLCDRPVVEIHELCHVFGFDHSENPSSIMYNTTSCNQKITSDMVDLIQRLYSVEPLADARISAVSAVLRGKYLDFNITVLNEGLKDITNLSLSVVIKGEEIDIISLGSLEVGYGRTLKVKDLRLSSRNSDEIDFVLDYHSLIDELDKKNNVVTVFTA